MMLISEMTDDKIQPGLQVRSTLSGRLGVIEHFDVKDDGFVWICWDGEPQAYGGVYQHQGNTVEVVTCETSSASSPESCLQSPKPSGPGVRGVSDT